MNDNNKRSAAGCPLHQIEEISDDIYRSFKKRLSKKYRNEKPGKALHAKTIGVVKAVVKVLPDLSESLSVGLFKRTEEYEAVIRFSNGSSHVSNDISPSVRGMAIKIMIGDELQDILLTTNRIHFPVKIGLQRLIPKIVFAKLPGQIFYGLIISVLSKSFSKVLKFRKGIIKTPNILEEMYFSATPYAFGEKKAVKWHVRPCKTIASVIPDHPGGDFLRNQLIKDLSKESVYSVSFGLYVQFQENSQTEPIEDPSVEWKTPFYQVATIEIPKQDITTDELRNLDKTINFSPGNCIEAHAPLGEINRIRVNVYKALSRDRTAVSLKPEKL
jgi:catalase